MEVLGLDSGALADGQGHQGEDALLKLLFSTEGVDADQKRQRLGIQLGFLHVHQGLSKALDDLREVAYGEDGLTLYGAQHLDRIDLGFGDDGLPGFLDPLFGLGEELGEFLLILQLVDRGVLEVPDDAGKARSVQNECRILRKSLENRWSNDDRLFVLGYRPGTESDDHDDEGK